MIHMQLTDILMDLLPNENPWEGNIKGLVERLIDNGVTVQKWISVKEKLPPFHKQVLVISGGKIYVAEELLTWEDGHAAIYIRDFGKWRKFTHWMPLPEPPKEV